MCRSDELVAMRSRLLDNRQKLYQALQNVRPTKLFWLYTGLMSTDTGQLGRNLDDKRSFRVRTP